MSIWLSGPNAVGGKHDLRADLVGQRLILLVANEAARAALTKGSAHSRMALILARSFGAAAAGANRAIWAKHGRLETRPLGRCGKIEANIASGQRGRSGKSRERIGQYSYGPDSRAELLGRGRSCQYGYLGQTRSVSIEDSRRSLKWDTFAVSLAPEGASSATTTGNPFA